MSRTIKRKTCLYEHKKGRKLNLNLLPELTNPKSGLYTKRFATTTFRPCIGIGNFEA